MAEKKMGPPRATMDLHEPALLTSLVSVCIYLRTVCCPWKPDSPSFFFLNVIYFIFGCTGSLLLCTGFSWVERQLLFVMFGLFISVTSLDFSYFRTWAWKGMQASGAVACGLSECFPGSNAQASQLWQMGLVAPRYVASSTTRDLTCVPHTGG